MQLRPRAKVVVMDARGSKRAVRLARTLLASGISQAHIVQVQRTYGAPNPKQHLYRLTLCHRTP